MEDVTPPEKPLLLSSEITLQGNKLTFAFTIGRKLDKTDGYGYATQAELQSNTALLGPGFPHFVRDYRLYACNRPEVILNPDDADFLSVAKPNTTIGGSGKRFSIRMLPGALKLKKVSSTAAELSGSATFANTQGLENMPARLYICLRATNYLGTHSHLTFVPMTYRTSLVVP